MCVLWFLLFFYIFANLAQYFLNAFIIRLVANICIVSVENVAIRCRILSKYQQHSSKNKLFHRFLCNVMYERSDRCVISRIFDHLYHLMMIQISIKLTAIIYCINYICHLQFSTVINIYTSVVVGLLYLFTLLFAFSLLFRIFLSQMEWWSDFHSKIKLYASIVLAYKNGLFFTVNSMRVCVVFCRKDGMTTQLPQLLQQKERIRSSQKNFLRFIKYLKAAVQRI